MADAGANGDRAYNDTFERLVDRSNPDVDDIRGMVAYSLYKLDKQQWACRLVDEQGRRPEQADLKGYMQTIVDSRIEGLLNQADERINNFARIILESNKEAIEEAAVERARAGIEHAALKEKFWSEVLAGLVAAAGYTTALIILAFVLKYFGIDLLHAYEKTGPATAQSETH